MSRKVFISSKNEIFMEIVSEKHSQVRRWDISAYSEKEHPGRDYRVEEETSLDGHALNFKTNPTSVETIDLISAARRAVRVYEKVVYDSVGNWPTEVNDLHHWAIIGEYFDETGLTRPDKQTIEVLMQSTKLPKDIKDLLRKELRSETQ
jgi:hypothetical protein